MSEGMSSWRSLASSAGTRVKGYINSEPGVKGTYTIRGLLQPAPQEDRQNWREWAGQKVFPRRRGNGEGSLPSTEIVSLFPGWAARRYAADTGTEAIRPFEVEAFISGYAVSHRSLENASRTQRTFIRLAKSFAALPKLVEDPNAAPNTLYSVPLTASTEELLKQVKLPPRPTEITEGYEIEALEREYQRIRDNNSDSASSSPSSSISDLPQDAPISEASTISPEVFRRLHANLESRLQPFWFSAVANRTIRLHLFASPHQNPPRADSIDETDALGIEKHKALATHDVFTGPDGSFQARFKVDWEAMCQHSEALHIAFGDAVAEHNFKVIAQLMPPTLTPSPQAPPVVQSSPASCMIKIPITHCPIRVISDIDDTVKRSDIMSGARAVFKNVFVKELQENVIPGMGEWYQSMFTRGVRFHYVSNGPFEILPIVNDFLKVAGLPPGSIKLRSYAGRSLFSGLLSAPAARKRAGLVDILDSFPESKFFLIGDSGEQDLELYADIARERPDTILAVFIRDVDSGEPINDPTGWDVMDAAGTRPSSAPLVPRSDSTTTSPVDSVDRANQETIFVGMKRALSDHVISRLSSTSSGSATSSQKKKTSLLSVLEIPENGSQYFSSAPISDEPEAFANGKGGELWPPSSTAQASTTTFSGPSPSPTESSLKSPLSTRVYAKLINKATPPLSLSIKSSAMQSNSSFASTSSMEPTRKASLPDAQRRRSDLQMRVCRARMQIPGHIPLRIFRDPSECVEANEVLADCVG